MLACGHPPANLDEALRAACDGMAGITPARFRALLSPEDIKDVEAGAIHPRTLKAYALSFAKGIQIILADPPRSYRDSANAGKRGAVHKHRTLSLPEICALDVRGIAAPNCFLALWWVPPMPLEALEVVKAWGFELKAMKGFTWHKTTKHGKSHFGMGHWTRTNTEDCLFAVRGKPKRANADVSQFVEAPRGRHSATASSAARMNRSAYFTRPASCCSRTGRSHSMR